ncbi:MAG: aminoglycoside phosphotransferase family protein [Anaerolinea sp.]|nr:aminoglycoside phosphotransferase family protein [Anaerolinea sp.]
MERLPFQVTNWIVSHLDSSAEIKEVVRLQGSTSSDLYTVQIRERVREFNLVLRLLTNQQWLQEEPDLAEHEAAALAMAKKSGLCVPEVIAWDTDGQHCGTPAVLMTSVPGMVNLQPQNFDNWLRQMAAALQPLHELSAADFGWQYFCYNDVKTLKVPTWTAQPSLWERAIEIVNRPPPPTKTCFIHRDYHPMNTLWQDETLSGVVDWVNACRGPAAFDLAWNRLNLMQMYGVEAANHMRDQALAICGTEVWHPYWDLMALIEMLPGPPEVYEPWPVFGLRDLSAPLMIQRADEYLASVLESI